MAYKSEVATRPIKYSNIAALVYTLSLLTLDNKDASASNYLRELACGLDLTDDKVCLPIV